MHRNTYTLITSFGEKEGLIWNASIWQIHQDRTGFLWIGTDNGLYRFDGTFVVPLVKAIQEQQKIIGDLKQQNQVLQNQIQIIKKKLGLE